MIIVVVLLLRKPKAPKNPGRDRYDDEYDDYEDGRKNRKSGKQTAKKSGMTAKAPERRPAARPAARTETLPYEEEEEAPRRRQPAAQTRRPAVQTRETVRTERPSAETGTAAPERPARPVRKNVADVEKDLSRNLAKEAEAAKSAPVKKTENDDDFEFIDLDL